MAKPARSKPRAHTRGASTRRGGGLLGPGCTAVAAAVRHATHGSLVAAALSGARSPPPGKLDRRGSHPGLEFKPSPIFTAAKSTGHHLICKPHNRPDIPGPHSVASKAPVRTRQSRHGRDRCPRRQEALRQGPEGRGPPPIQEPGGGGGAGAQGGAPRAVRATTRGLLHSRGCGTPSNRALGLLETMCDPARGPARCVALAGWATRLTAIAPAASSPTAEGGLQPARDQEGDRRQAPGRSGRWI